MRKPMLGVAVAAATAVLAAPAIAVSPTLRIVGGPSFKANRYMKDTQRFSRDVTVVSSGATVTIRNRTNEPHTVSLVTKAQLPRTMKQLFSCYEGGVCGQLAGAHEFPEGDGPPGKPLVDVGAAGFDRAGDSVIINPKGAPGSTQKLKFTAASGKTLYFLCALHPQMQGRFKVGK